MNLYVIELKDRIKVGISKNDIKERVSNILSAGGHGKNDVLNIYNFPNNGYIEGTLKRLFKRFLIEKSEISRSSEWFYKKGIIEQFIKRIKNKEIPSRELIDKLQYDNSDSSSFYKKNALKLYEKVKNERKGIGFPNSVTFDEFMKFGEMRYKNMHYKVNDEFTNFSREPKFDLDFITKSQSVECLRIIKNNTNSSIKQTKIQSFIDDVFNGVNETLPFRLNLISNYFFDGELLITCENKNIRINFCEDFNYYFLNETYENLNIEEQILIKKSKGIFISPNKIIFQYKEKNCICKYENTSMTRIKNLLKNRDYCDYSYIEEILEEAKIDYPSTKLIPIPIEKHINDIEDVDLFYFLCSRNVSFNKDRVNFNFGEYIITWKYKDSIEKIYKFLESLDIIFVETHEMNEK